MSSSSPRRLATPLAIMAAVTVVGGGAGLAYFFLGGDAPAPPSLGSPAPVGSATPQTSPSTVPSAVASEPAASAAVDGIEGVWTVDTSVGSFADFSGTWAGFRVDEVLGNGIGSTQAVGRTPDVSGSLTIEGSTLIAAALEVDLTGIVSDRPRRDDAIARTLETRAFPTASFELTSVVELGPEASSGSVVSVEATGRLTIHGVTRDVTVPLDARLVDGRTQVVGSVPFAFADYGMQAPSAPIVLSVSDAGSVEFQLFFAR